MRILQKETLENRKRKLLQAVIFQYVRTAKPVGSHVIVDKYNFGLSSATVRNLLSDLEKEGYLIQPHTSAGRVPTDKGYRFYVDSLLEIQSLAATEEDRIRKEYAARSKELEAMMISTSQMLSALSNYTGVVLSPRMDKTLLRRLQLVSLGGNQILVVVVSQAGHIRHRVVTLKRPLSAERLSAISSLLNERLINLPLTEVRAQILDHIEAVQQEQEDAFSLAKDVVREAFELNPADQELYVGGKEHIIDFPELNDLQQLSTLLKVVEEKNLLASMLEKEIKKGGGLSVKIGSENKLPQLRGISLVSSTYKIGENAVGVLGILGPRRMEYARMISLVEGVTRIVNQMMTRFDKEVE